MTGGETGGTVAALRTSVAQPAYQTWQREKLVPYIDLQLGARLLDRTLKDTLVRQMLFPRVSEGPEWESVKRRLKRHQLDFLGDGGYELLLRAGV